MNLILCIVVLASALVAHAGDKTPVVVPVQGGDTAATSKFGDGYITRTSNGQTYTTPANPTSSNVIISALEPLPPIQPTPALLLPQPVLIIQQNGQLVITDKGPVPVVILQTQTQTQPQLWTTSTGEVLMPLNLQQQPREGAK